MTCPHLRRCGGRSHAPASVARHSRGWEGIRRDYGDEPVRFGCRAPGRAEGRARAAGRVPPAAGAPCNRRWAGRVALGRRPTCRAPGRGSVAFSGGAIDVMSRKVGRTCCAGEGPGGGAARASPEVTVMTDHDSPAGRAACRGRRCAALIAAGVLLPLPVLTGCSGDDSEASAAASQDIGRMARGQLKDGGTVRWAVDSMPGTLNAYQADADATTARIAGAVLPSLFTVDGRGSTAAQPGLPPGRGHQCPRAQAGRHLQDQPEGAVERRTGRSAPRTSSPSGTRCAARTTPSGAPATSATTGSRRSRRAPTRTRSRSPSPSRTRTGGRSSRRSIPRA